MLEHQISKQEVDKHSLRGKIYQQLRLDILSGKYQDNMGLKENTIAKEYGISRTPVREAIRQLELEGLVISIPNKGTYVKRIHKKDVEDIYSIRILLEGLCARWVAKVISDEQIATLEEILYMAEYHREHQNVQQLYECDSKFHNTLYEACGSEILCHTLKDYHQYVQMARKYALGNAPRATNSLNEHRAILEAIKARDEEEAANLATYHIKRVVENYHKINIEQMIEE